MDELEDDYCIIDDDIVTCEYQIVFKYLHTLASKHKNIMVDYYIYDIPVKSLANKYRLSESTIKWRLNIGRKKIKERIEVNEMDKVYKRIKC